MYGGATKRTSPPLYGVARRSRDGGVKVHQTQKIHSNRRHGGALRRASPRMTSNRKISPHQSLRDSFSSRRSRLTAHRLRFMGWHGGAVTEGFESHREQNISTKNQQGLFACLLIYAIKLKMPQERL